MWGYFAIAICNALHEVFQTLLNIQTQKIDKDHTEPQSDEKNLGQEHPLPEECQTFFFCQSSVVDQHSIPYVSKSL